MAWLLRPGNKLSIFNKDKIYKVVLAPIWKYGFQVYGIAARSHLNKIRVARSQILRKLSGAAWYIPNKVIEQELKVPRIGDVINKQTTAYQYKLGSDTNQMALKLLTRRRGGLWAKRRLHIHPTDLPRRYKN